VPGQGLDLGSVIAKRPSSWDLALPTGLKVPDKICSKLARGQEISSVREVLLAAQKDFARLVIPL